MRSNFSRLSKPEVDLIIKKTNFTEEEEAIFHMLCRGKSLDQICLETFLPKSTLCRRIHSIKEKVGDNKMSVKVPIWEKVTLTLEEAAEYSNIGINKIYRPLFLHILNFIGFAGLFFLLSALIVLSFLYTSCGIITFMHLSIICGSLDSAFTAITAFSFFNTIASWPYFPSAR